MPLFDTTLNSIEHLLRSKSKNALQKGFLIEDYSNFTGPERSNQTKLYSVKASEAEQEEADLTTLFGNVEWKKPRALLGPHPDFEDMAHGEMQQHYAVSMFADIKGSTRLNANYDLTTIRRIKDYVLTLAIEVCSFFGGHIQRLQGDGVFVYFVGRNVIKNDAIISALNAASTLTYFVNTRLALLFQQLGVKPLKIRVGIDYGDDDQVLWSHYGIPGCSELTTTSLHTDLAAKLQARALSNGILIGENVRKKIDLPSEYFSVPVLPVSKKPLPYIFNGPPKYRNWVFDWQKYLLTFDFVNGGTTSGIRIEVPEYRLQCRIKNDGQELRLYSQNLYSLPKGTNLEFQLMRAKGAAPFLKLPTDTITWEVINTGAEAIAAGQERHDLGKLYDGKTVASTNAAYLGQHQIICRVKRDHLPNFSAKYFIFVQ
jgi:adenylate cyclase